MSLRRRTDELRLAMMVLTRLPMGTLREPVPGMAAARWAYPLAGLPVGLVGWAVLAAAQATGLSPLVAAYACLGAMAAVTGGLHHDGLADFVDGLGGRDRAHRLEIMRDSRIGSYGVIALIFVTGLSAGALSTVPVTLGAWAGMLLVSTASRLAMLLTLDLLPPARPDGLGRMARSTEGGQAWRAGLFMTLVLSLSTGFAALAVLPAIAVAAFFVASRARRLLGGQSGDVLGAVQLTAECAGFLALSAAL